MRGCSVIRRLGAVTMVGFLSAAATVGTAATVGAAAPLAGTAHASAANCRPGWSVQPASPELGVNQLQAVATISPCDTWVVGFDSSNARTSPYRTLIEQWNGRAWRVHRSPNPGRSNGSQLFGVAATSSRNVWAVGDYNNGTAYQNLIEHRNGKRWSVQTTPNPGSSYNELAAVAATSPTDAWAVGNSETGSRFQTLILHWNGRSWRVQTSATPHASRYSRRAFFVQAGLTGVAALSPHDAWAVGFHYNGTADQTLIEHWNGKRWRVQTSPDPSGSALTNYLRGVAATAPNNAWAVGDDLASGAGPANSLVEHWNGKKWKAQKSPNPGGVNGTLLYGVAATSPRAAWAVGDDNNNGPQDPALVESWKGSGWKLQSSADLTSSALLGVAATSPANVWAVGDYYNGRGEEALALHCC